MPDPSQDSSTPNQPHSLRIIKIVSCPSLTGKSTLNQGGHPVARAGQAWQQNQSRQHGSHGGTLITKNKSADRKPLPVCRFRYTYPQSVTKMTAIAPGQNSMRTDSQGVSQCFRSWLFECKISLSVVKLLRPVYNTAPFSGGRFHLHRYFSALDICLHYDFVLTVQFLTQKAKCEEFPLKVAVNGAVSKALKHRANHRPNAMLSVRKYPPKTLPHVH